MKTLVCTEPRKLEYHDRPTPQVTEKHAVIRIRRIGVCGTDLHAYEGTQPFLSYPRVLGHELAGELVAFVNAPGFEMNEVVSFIPYFSCGYCVACRTGKTNCCTTIRVCGVHADGGMAEYITVPSDSLLHAHGLSVDEMALVEPLAIGAHGVRRADIRPGEFVLVIGAGPIGIGTMEFAKIAGAKVIAMDLNNSRLEFCKQQIGVNHVINALDPHVFQYLQNLTNGDMPAVVIDATGSLKAINEGFKFLSHGGRYVLIGLQRGDISFSHPEFHKREATLMSSRNATRQDFEHVIASLRGRKINPANYITHRANFDAAAAEFEHWLNPASGVIKAMIELN